jgi:hypothetical protein
MENSLTTDSVYFFDIILLNDMLATKILLTL